MNTQTGRERLQKLTDLIKDIRIAMLTTATPDGSLRSRPMATLLTGPDSELWFFTEANAAKAEEIRASPQVSVSYSEPKDNRYVSVSGKATLVRDRQKMESLWDQSYHEWFPRGLENPDLALLRIDIGWAEYWDAPSGKMAEIADFLKAPAPGEHEKMDLSNAKV